MQPKVSGFTLNVGKMDKKNLFHFWPLLSEQPGWVILVQIDFSLLANHHAKLTFSNSTTHLNVRDTSWCKNGRVADPQEISPTSPILTNLLQTMTWATFSANVIEFIWEKTFV